MFRPSPSFPPTAGRFRALLVAALASALLVTALPGAVAAQQTATQRYLVTYNGTYALSGKYALGGDYALNHQYALSLVGKAGGTVVSDMSRQIGVMVVDSVRQGFADAMRQDALVASVVRDFSWKEYPTVQEAIASGQLKTVNEYALGEPAAGEEPLQELQWGLRMIRAPKAHTIEDGWRKVDVGVIDTGIDAAHIDFIRNGTSNVDIARGASFAGSLDVATDNGFHGTHVAGIIAARANDHGVLGVAPNVTLVPIKVCDASGYCYASSVAQGITYAGDIRLDVINMSLFADDDPPANSTQFKCKSDPEQYAFRVMVERAVKYARFRGAAPVAAIGNSGTDLRRPGQTQPGATDEDCDVVPAEVEGVTATVALGPDALKSSYSSYGFRHADVAAPGGDAEELDETCTAEIISTLPGNSWGCLSGTSMASPHVAGVAALIVSRSGTLGSDGDVKVPVGSVDARLKSTAVDIGKQGYDKCYGHGRLDALRAVKNVTKDVFTSSGCSEY